MAGMLNWYDVRITTFEYNEIEEILGWLFINCKEEFSRQIKCLSDGSFELIVYFESKEDAVAFKLKWL